MAEQSLQKIEIVNDRQIKVGNLIVEFKTFLFIQSNFHAKYSIKSLGFPNTFCDETITLS